VSVDSRLVSSVLAQLALRDRRARLRERAKWSRTNGRAAHRARVLDRAAVGERLDEAVPRAEGHS
jgi:hypothetical protein